MPEWSGDDVLSMLNTLNNPRKFVVIISGFMDDKMRAGFESHPNVFRILDKPFSTREISAILEAAVVENRIERRSRREDIDGV
jgi:FixJ family two-component response regulator